MDVCFSIQWQTKLKILQFIEGLVFFSLFSRYDTNLFNMVEHKARNSFMNHIFSIEYCRCLWLVESSFENDFMIVAHTFHSLLNQLTNCSAEMCMIRSLPPCFAFLSFRSASWKILRVMIMLNKKKARVKFSFGKCWSKMHRLKYRHGIPFEFCWNMFMHVPLKTNEHFWWDWLCVCAIFSCYCWLLSYINNFMDLRGTRKCREKHINLVLVCWFHEFRLQLFFYSKHFKSVETLKWAFFLYVNIFDATRSVIHSIVYHYWLNTFIFLLCLWTRFQFNRIIHYTKNLNGCSEFGLLNIDFRCLKGE